MYGSIQLLALTAALPSALACLAYTGGVPTATGTVSSSAVIDVAAGDTFDCGWKRYDRGSGACGSGEGTYKDAVFYLHSGATLKNCIIGANQAEGVHCDGPCTLEYVWHENVCEDGISIVSSCARICSGEIQEPMILTPSMTQKNDKSGDETWIIGGGAYGADDKTVQHNGCGTVNVSGLWFHFRLRYLSSTTPNTQTTDHQFLRQGLRKAVSLLWQLRHTMQTHCQHFGSQRREWR